MTAPVDLTNLRSMTDGDVELETALFEEFFSSFEVGAQALHAHLSGDGETWRKKAHAIKGIALNLGAGALGDLCSRAQEAHTSSADDKREILSRIEKEYSLVRDFLTTVA